MNETQLKGKSIADIIYPIKLSTGDKVNVCILQLWYIFQNNKVTFSVVLPAVQILSKTSSELSIH